MKLVWIVIPLILIGIAGTLFIASQTSQFQRDEIENKSKLYLENIPLTTITGVIKHWQPIDGPSYSIIPEEKINVNMANNQIFLYGEKLTSSLQDKKAKVTGKLIKNYVEYKNTIGMPVFGGDPDTAVIFVSDIEIIDEESTLSNYPIEMTIPSNNYCNVNSDCVFHYSSCRVEVCWNKDNLPEPISSEPYMGMCLPPSNVSECMCEKNRCQPIPDDRISQSIYYQPCESDLNCFADETCLDYNMKSFHGVALKRHDPEYKQCHLQCNSDSDCHPGYCISAKLVSDEIYDKMSGIKPPWDNHPLIVDAPDVKYCSSYQP